MSLAIRHLMPEEWAIEVLGRSITSMTDGPFGSNLASQHYTDSGARVIRLGNVGAGKFKDDDRAYVSLDRYRLLARHAVEPGDIIVAGLGDENNSLGRACIVPNDLGPAIVKADCFRVRINLKRYDPRYLVYFFSSELGKSIAQQKSRGSTRQRMNLRDVASLTVPCPPLGEQQRIADFLDAESTRLDRVIVARRHQVQLLEERSSTRILNAVRGVGEHGERVDSGLSWLGDIPKNWPLLSVATQFDVLLGKMLNPDRVSGEHLRPYLRNTNVQWDRIDVEDLLLMNFPPRERSRYEVLPGDLLICEGGQPGRAAIWTGPISEVYYQKALHRARSRGRSLVRWLFYCLKAATDLNVFAVEGNAATISHLTGEQLRAYRFPFPDRAIQERMVSDLDAAALRDLHLNMRLEQQLQLMVERRQALITAAVTGQIDVTTMRRVQE